MKTDDDTFVRVDAVLSAIQNSRHNHSILLGNIEFTNEPERDESNKWFVSMKVWNHFSYQFYLHSLYCLWHRIYCAAYLHNKVLHVCAWWISLHLLPSPARTARCAHWSRKTWSWLTGLCFEFCIQVLMPSVSLLQEWESSTYPPWAHGPGYVFSRDIAKFVVEGHQKDILKVTYTYLACLFL